MTRRTRVFLAPIIAPFVAISAAAAEPSAPYDWRGFYLGYHIGGALGLVDVDNPFGPSIFGDTARTPGPLAGGQLGYNWQSGRGLLGLEADASFADMDGTNTCFAYSGFYVSANCRAEIDALGTLAARFGWLPFDGRTLVYGKAGSRGGMARSRRRRMAVSAGRERRRAACNGAGRSAPASNAPSPRAGP